jgi:hypothetical protein
MLQCGHYKLELKFNKWGNVELIVQNVEQSMSALRRDDFAPPGRPTGEK